MSVSRGEPARSIATSDANTEQLRAILQHEREVTSKLMSAAAAVRFGPAAPAHRALYIPRDPER